MSRSRQQSTQEFGSDSFLDVLANMVGILIILIVIAGARLSRMPAASLLSLGDRPPTAGEAGRLPSLPVKSPVAEPDSLPDGEPIVAKKRTNFDAELKALDEEIARLTELSEAGPPKEFVSQLISAERELNDMAAKVRARSAELQQGDAGTAEMQAKTDALSRSVQALVVRVSQTRQKLGVLEQTVTGQERALSGLLAEFEQTKNSRPPTVEVKHRLTPVAQAITGEEHHFRVENDRVAVVPLAELLDRVKTQIERNRETIMKLEKYQGQVGPVHGFVLNYNVQRQDLGILDRARFGGRGGVYRWGVTYWEIDVERDSHEETFEQATRSGGRFRKMMQSLPPRANLTFWVYPDSFPLFRKLQEIAHQQGFIVSARPLPDGIPISGSPSGSASVGQ